MGKILRKLGRKYALTVVFLGTLLLGHGGAFPGTTYILLSLSLLMIFLSFKRRGYLRIKSKEFLRCECLLIIGTLISAYKGIDRGESIYGVIRIFTILSIGCWLQQLEEKEKEFCFRSVPYMGVVLICMSLPLKYFSCADGWLSNTGRLAGPFTYANTMALFLLAGIILAEHFDGKRKCFFQILLCFGLLWTGSRTAFTLFAGYLLLKLLKHRGKIVRLFLIFAAVVLAVIMITALGVRVPVLTRFMRIGFGESTFQGRLLYWEDACRMILKYPMGLGYMGYFYMQQVMQTGVYSVRFVHNEWLQCFLDYGILGGICAGWYCISWFGTKEVAFWKKELTGLILMYSFFDFHCQFWVILFLMLMLMEEPHMRHWTGFHSYNELQTVADSAANCSRKRKQMSGYIFLAGSAVTAAFAGCVGAAELFAGQGNYEKAVLWNPLSAEYRLNLLLDAPDLDAAIFLADEALACNEYIYAAYEIKSNAAAQSGDIESFVENRKQVLKLRKYDREKYEEYFQILMSLYMDACGDNDFDEMAQCVEAMEEIPEIMDNVKKATSVRAFLIQDKPELYLKKEYVEIIRMLKGDRA